MFAWPCAISPGFALPRDAGPHRETWPEVNGDPYRRRHRGTEPGREEAERGADRRRTLDSGTRRRAAGHGGMTTTPVPVPGAPPTLVSGTVRRTAKPPGETGSAAGATRTPQGSDADSRWLADAIAELDQLDSYIANDGLPPIGDRARAEIKRILETLSPQPITPIVYPAEGEEGEIVIQFTAVKAPGMVTIDVGNDGQGMCIAHVQNTTRSRSYAASSTIPDDFVLEQLRKLSLAE